MNTVPILCILHTHRWLRSLGRQLDLRCLRKVLAKPCCHFSGTWKRHLKLGSSCNKAGCCCWFVCFFSLDARFMVCFTGISVLRTLTSKNFSVESISCKPQVNQLDILLSVTSAFSVHGDAKKQAGESPPRRKPGQCFKERLMLPVHQFPSLHASNVDQGKGVADTTWHQLRRRSFQ